ncbi:hypothetical protein GWK47_054747 [Chionoecetes opilio]|uniref:Uncharacterized protein n=1 Tax=Chionoecetes opilio TaxID=41210 RepID=A0A8J4Y9G2_CHIOP|nr:hypothetical protein GWK47_054747 [Chionoecetes opilio]
MQDILARPSPSSRLTLDFSPRPVRGATLGRGGNWKGPGGSCGMSWSELLSWRPPGGRRPRPRTPLCQNRRILNLAMFLGEIRMMGKVFGDFPSPSAEFQNFQFSTRVLEISKNQKFGA